MKTLSLAILVALFTLPALAGPAQIVLVRHGEKPLGDDQGTQLTPAGCERAMLLPDFFIGNHVVEKFGKPVAIYASRPDGTQKSSLRPIQTALPTAASPLLQLKVQAPFVADRYAELANLVMNNQAYDGKTVLIVWDHSKILELTQALGAALPSGMEKWPDYVYDEALVIRPGKKLKIIPESVLPSDNSEGGASWNTKPTGTPSGITVSQAIADECKNNDILNEMATSSVVPAL